MNEFTAIIWVDDERMENGGYYEPMTIKAADLHSAVKVAESICKMSMRHTRQFVECGSKMTAQEWEDWLKACA